MLLLLLPADNDDDDGVTSGLNITMMIVAMSLCDDDGDNLVVKLLIAVKSRTACNSKHSIYSQPATRRDATPRSHSSQYAALSFNWQAG